MSKPLNNRQRVFIEEYLTCWDATKAARKAGYKDNELLHTNANKLLRNTTIRNEIQKRFAEKVLSADEVLARLSEHAKGNFDYFSTKDGAIDLTTEKAREHFHLLKKIRTRRIKTKDGEDVIETEIELHDPQAALVHIKRYHALFTDKMKSDNEIILKVVDETSDTDTEHEEASEAT